MKILITGASGQDAKELIRQLKSTEHQIHVISRSKRIETEFNYVNLHTIRSNVLFATESFLKSNAFDVIFHAASISNPSDCEQNPKEAKQINVDWVKIILESISGIGTKFIFFSSGSIFGDVSSQNQRFNEFSPHNPKSVYAETKALATELVRDARNSGTWASNLILFNHESLNRNGNYLFPEMCRRLTQFVLEGEDITVRNQHDIGDWGVARDYMKAAISLAKLNDPTDLVIATGISRSVGQLIADIARELKIVDYRITSIVKTMKRSVYVDPSASIGLLGQYNSSSVIDLAVQQVHLALSEGS